jgi:ribonuclease D
MKELLWVDTQAKLREVVQMAKDCESVALDAEMDSYYSYRTKLCLVQMTLNGHDVLIDPLALNDLSLLNEVTENPSIRKVFHAGENDVPYFREHGVVFQGIFDTHIAAKVLELPTKSYGGLVERYFEVVLAKDQSRADWRLRPLPDEQVEYARQDTLHLCALAEILAQELREAEAEVEADHHFRALEPRTLREKAFDSEGWAKIKGARELTPVQWSVLSELYAWREKRAEEADLAAFRVAHNGALLSLSRKRFTRAEQLRGWAKSNFFRDHAEDLVNLMLKGKERGPIPYPDLRKKTSADWSSADEKLFNKLRQWRNEESERRGIDASRVLSNKQLKSIARQRPKTQACLLAVEGLEAWSIEQYGTAILQRIGDVG